MTADTTLRLRRSGGRWVAHGAASCRVGAPPADIPEGQEPFAEWSWDGERLSVRNDRYGLQPMFVATEPGGLILSTSLEGALRAGAPATPDDAALAVLIRLGSFVGDDTPFESVKTLAPQADVSLDGERPRVTGGPLIPPRSGLGRDAALGAYVELFRQAMARRPAAGRCAVPLSGGRDSRHILFELVASGRRPDLVVTARHHPPKHNEDVRIAAEVARALELRHDIVEQPAERVEAELRKNPLTEYGAPDMHSWYLVVQGHLQGRADTMYDGFGGDVLSMARYLNPADLAHYRAGRLRELAERMLGVEWLSRMVRPEVSRRWSRRLAVERLVRELEVHAGAPNPVRSFRLWSYGRRKIATAPCGIFTGLGVRMPFMDPDLYTMLAGLDPEVIMAERGHFHTRALALGYPALAHLPFEDTALPAVHDGRYYRRFASQVAGHLMRSGMATALDRTAVWLRLARCLAGGGFSSTMALLGPWVIYLGQLEAMAGRAARNGTEPMGIGRGHA